jgi:hypothetical protein
MSSYGKRTASSPRENMAKLSRGTFEDCETNADSLVKIEFETINGKPFFGQISDDELLYIWVTVFNRKKEELFGITSTKSLTRNVRATFKLKTPTKIKEIFESAQFTYEKFLEEEDNGREVISGKILNFNVIKPAEIGDLVKISVKTNLGVEANGVVNWLKIYGTVSSLGAFVVNPVSGLATDVYETEITLKKHVPEYLPMFGQKAMISYRGIPRMCNRCFLSGHMRKECNNTKRDWVAYIVHLIDTEGINPELIGSWKNAVARWRNANSSTRAKTV